MNKFVTVKTVPVTYESFALPIVSSGLITSDKESRLSFKIGGIISRLMVNEGDRVSKGQLLALLNQTEINAQLMQTKNSMDKAQRDYRRTNNLYIDSSATQEEHENSKTALETAQQSYTINRFNKQFAAIYANQSGRVIKKLMNEGEVANPGAPIYIINSTNDNDWVIRIGVSDKDWARIKRNDPAMLTTEAYPDQQLHAVVSEIGEAADPATGTFLIKVKIKPGQVRLANGLSAKITITPSQSQKFNFIPVDALIEANQQTATVYSASPDRQVVKKHTIAIAFIVNNRVAVRSGLDGIDEIITDGSAYLTPASKIKISNN
ncbi:MAG: efflux RND transporter periplasmic adaptor subunit [Chitinophagaceae bacterium]